MDALISVFLPASLAFIMFSLGLGLTIADFTRVFAAPRALFAGFAAQVVLLPLAALAVVTAFGLEGAMAFGVMILSVCPGGVTSNMMTKLARGALALSISLTGVISLLSVVTVPFLIALWASMFLDGEAFEVEVGSLAVAMFVITAAPVALGMIVRRFAAGVVGRIEKAVETIAGILFVVIVIGALASSWDVFTENLGVLGPVTLTMVFGLLALGWIVAAALRLSPEEKAAISIETGVQNAALGVTLAGLIAGGEGALPAIALPAAMYGVLMYLGGVPAALLMRRLVKGETK
ncbi:MAG: bile acid:sodium symporter [Pseudomonadota bacterium]